MLGQPGIFEARLFIIVIVVFFALFRLFLLALFLALAFLRLAVVFRGLAGLGTAFAPFCVSRAGLIVGGLWRTGAGGRRGNRGGGYVLRFMMAIIMTCIRRRVRHLGSEPGGLNMAFNVERMGVLKLMQGQRRSFEQPDVGTAWCSCRGASARKRQRLQAPRSPALGAPFGGRGGPSFHTGREGEKGCVISGWGFLSATASRRDFFDGTPPRGREDIAHHGMTC